jgi:putative membrane protein
VRTVTTDSRSSNSCNVQLLATLLIELKGPIHIDTSDSHVPDQRTQLAAIRTVLALDRTLLAWVRTALSLMAGGVAFDQGSRLLHDERLKAGTALVRSGHFVGIGVTVISTVLIALAILAFLKDLPVATALLQRRPSRIPPSLISAVLVMILGILTSVVLTITGS